MGCISGAGGKREIHNKKEGGSEGAYVYNGEISEFQMTSSTERLDLCLKTYSLCKNTTVIDI